MNRILGIWAVAAGISLGYSFLRQYRARPRYLYMGFLAAWAILWGIGRLRADLVIPGAVLWALFLAGVAAMLMDSVRRYRETSERLKRERMERLAASSDPGKDDR